MFKLLKKINPIVALLVLAIITISVALYLCMINKETFDPLPLADDKLLMVANSSGDIEPIPMERLNKYFRSLETDITNNKQTGGVDLPTFNSFKTQIESSSRSLLNDLTTNYIKKGVNYPIKIGSNFNTKLLF